MDLATIRSYDERAVSFAKEWEEEQPEPEDLQTIVRRYFRHGVTVDVGCGSGRDAAWLADSGFTVVGVDAAPALLAEATRRHAGVRFQVGALPELDCLTEGSFVNVLCETVIMHLDTQVIPAAVRKLVRLLEPHGILYLSWRVTEGSDVRDGTGRLYSAFDQSLVLTGLSDATIELNEQKISVSSAKTVHRIVARRNEAPA